MMKLILRIFVYSFLIVLIFFTFYFDIYTKIKILSITLDNIGITNDNDIKNLRKFLNKEHIKYCENKKLYYLKNDNDLKSMIEYGYLKKLISNTLFTVDSSVNYPFITKQAYFVLINVMKDFQMYFVKNNTILVKPVITSASRTDSFQIELRKKNKNASLKSSHCYGVSVDVWYNGFDFEMNNLEKFIYFRFNKYFPSIDNEKIKKILVEVLKKYQDESKIYVIYEREQPCFHITLLY